MGILKITVFFRHLVVGVTRETVSEYEKKTEVSHIRTVHLGADM